jgi:hypothetical protein
MKSQAKIFGLTAALLFAAACGKHDDYLYYLGQKAADTHLAVSVKEIHSAGAIDILWIIDNSPSMGAHQQAVIQNTNQFMHAFVQNRISWKMGLISTDISDQPYIGFSTPFDYTNTTPEATFGVAVNSLGLGGSGTERTFDPILKALTEHPEFERPGVPLAVLIVTDAIEQSSIDAPTFITQFHGAVGNRPVFVYPVLAATDLAPPGGCEPDESPYDYVGSPYEAFAHSAKLSHAYSICDPEFGANLGKIGNEIVQQIFHPEIRLTKRPKASSIVVKYQGNPLPSGPKAVGGMWYYDHDSNSVIFYSLEFAHDDTAAVEVEFVTDDGLPDTGTAPPENGIAISSARAITSSAFEDNWFEFDLHLDSPHNYPDAGAVMSPIVIEGAIKLKVYFTKISTRTDYDYVRIYDSERNRVQDFTGDIPDAFWSAEIPGDRCQVNIETFGGGNQWGYSISKVAAVFR